MYIQRTILSFGKTEVIWLLFCFLGAFSQVLRIPLIWLFLGTCSGTPCLLYILMVAQHLFQHLSLPLPTLSFVCVCVCVYLDPLSMPSASCMRKGVENFTGAWTSCHDHGRGWFFLTQQPVVANSSLGRSRAPELLSLPSTRKFHSSTLRQIIFQ